MWNVFAMAFVTWAIFVQPLTIMKTLFSRPIVGDVSLSLSLSPLQLQLLWTKSSKIWLLKWLGTTFICKCLLWFATSYILCIVMHCIWKLWNCLTFPFAFFKSLAINHFRWNQCSLFFFIPGRVILNFDYARNACTSIGQLWNCCPLPVFSFRSPTPTSTQSTVECKFVAFIHT